MYLKKDLISQFNRKIALIKSMIINTKFPSLAQIKMTSFIVNIKIQQAKKRKESKKK